MIYSVTLNPSLDYFIGLNEFEPGETNRTDSERIVAGGKGVNVSEVLRNMGFRTRDVVATAGFVGDEIERRLRGRGADCVFVRTPGLSRINVKIKSAQETEINGRGAPVGEEGIAEMLRALDGMTSGDVLVLSGNAARGTPADIYERFLRLADARGAFATVDAHGSLFRSTLAYAPRLVKPNLDELRMLYGADVTEDNVPEYADRLRADGARNAVVSLGGKGAVMSGEDGGLYRASPPAGRLVNSTGAGDSLVAGFIAATLRGASVPEAFRFAVATGSACAYAEGFPSESDVEALLPGCTVTVLRPPRAE